MEINTEFYGILHTAGTHLYMQGLEWGELGRDTRECNCVNCRELSSPLQFLSHSLSNYHLVVLTQDLVQSMRS